MSSRKEFVGIAHNIVFSMISRNNDVNGYWGMGMLYSHALKNNTNYVTLDLINGKIEPPSKNFESLLLKHLTTLKAEQKKRKMPETWLVDAKISIQFNKNEKENNSISKNLFGDRFVCKMIISDNLGRQRVAVRSASCRPHDSKRERKRSSQ